jgi:deoxyribonuclease-4
MYFGTHVSIRGGFLQAATTAHYIGAGSFQYFPKNPRSLQLKTFDRDDAAACARYSREHHLLSIAHAPYPTNLAIEDQEKRELVLRSILNDLEIVEACGSLGLVVHFGVYKGKNPLHGYQNIIQLLNEIIDKWRGNALLLIENQAGEGTTMGTTFEELVQIRSMTERPEQIGFCLDTCHAFASGLWNGDNWQKVEKTGKALGYFDHLRAVHLNDSVYPGGSRRDRHASVGQGQIGEENIRDFLTSEFVRDIPLVLETPAVPGFDHPAQIRYLKQLLSQ